MRRLAFDLARIVRLRSDRRGFRLPGRRAAAKLSVLAMVLAGALWSPALQARAAPQRTDLDRFAGHWIGVFAESQGPYRFHDCVHYEFERTNAGLVFRDHDPMADSTAAAVIDSESADQLRIRWRSVFPNPIVGLFALSPDGSRLRVMTAGGGMTGEEGRTFDLRRTDDPARTRNDPCLRSRLADTYVYRPPPSLDDGWEVADVRASGGNPRLLEAMVASIVRSGQGADPLRTDSVVIVQNGKIVFEEYFWGEDRNNPHIISSVMKSVLSVVAGIAVDQGLVDPDKPAVGYLPEAATSRWAREAYPITLHHLMSMTAGVEKAPLSLLLSSAPSAGILNSAKVEAPGERYSYDNGLPTLLGYILEKQAGEPLELYAQRTLFGPLGIENYRWTRQRDGVVLAAGGFYMTSRDMAKIGQLMLDGGVWRGRRIVSASWVARSTTQQTPPGGYRYGYYWHLATPEPRQIDAEMFMGIGQGYQRILVVPSRDLVIVMTSSNWTEHKDQSVDLINDYILPAFSGEKRSVRADGDG